ncbi:MAG: enoyl-CoA hydratase/isomerase family protein [Sphingomonadaceae bacterium]|nr:enoyl-CoA hydratase/isomerase family protein [Sphingomonadaceae bacterium]
MAVETYRDNDILICVLDRPERGNNLDAGVQAALLRAWRTAERDPAITAIVTRSSGKHFSVGAGADHLEEWAGLSLETIFAEHFSGKQGLEEDELPKPDELDLLGFNRWALSVRRIAKPMVAQISGAAAGGGLCLALLHHFRVGDMSARFAAAFGRLGLGPELGLLHTLPERIGIGAALELQLSGRIVRAEESLALGLLDRLVKEDGLDAATLEYARALAASPMATRHLLRARAALQADAFERALEREWADQKTLWGAADFQEGVVSLLEKRVPEFRSDASTL